MNPLDGWTLSREKLRIVTLASLFLLMPVDNLNAILQRAVGFGGSVSQVYKFSVLIMCYLSLDGTKRRLLSCGFVWAVTWSLIHGLTSPMADLGWVFSDFANMLKWQVLFAIYLFVDDVAVDNLKWLLRLFVTMFVWLGSNLILGVLGIGYSQYGDGEGSMGFFIAGNEVSGMQLVISSVVLAIAYRKGAIAYGILSVVAILFGAMKGTKTGAIGVFLLSALTPLVMGGLLRGKISIRKFLPMAFGSTFLIFVGGYVGALIVQKMGLVERFLYFMVRRGLLNALLSNREIRVAPFLSEFSEKWTLIQKLFGVGVPDAKMYGYIELDFPDALFSLGMLGFLILMLGWAAMIFRIARYAISGSRFASQMLLLAVMLMIICNMSGHILYSALAMPFLGVALGIIGAYARFEKESQQNRNWQNHPPHNSC